MNYYDEIIDKIEKLIDENQMDEANLLIDEELSMAYVPKETEDKLSKLKKQANSSKIKEVPLTEEQIEAFLKSDEIHQAKAINQMDKMNLRDLIVASEDFLKQKGNRDLKAFLIYSLITQEVNHEFLYVNDDVQIKFNPKDLKIVEHTDAWKTCKNALCDKYLKDPSKLSMAHRLIYVRAMYYLPKQGTAEEGLIWADEIIKEIEDAFSAK